MAPGWRPYYKPGGGGVVIIEDRMIERTAWEVEALRVVCSSPDRVYVCVIMHALLSMAEFSSRLYSQPFDPREWRRYCDERALLLVFSPPTPSSLSLSHLSCFTESETGTNI